MVFINHFNHIFRDLHLEEICAKAVRVPFPCSFCQQINYTAVIVFSADRKLHRDWFCAKFIFHLFENTEEVCTGAIHFIYITNSGDMILVSLSPNGFGLWFHSTNTTKDCNSTIKISERSFNFYGEVHMTGSIDDIYFVLLVIFFPEYGCSCGSNCDTTFLFLHHPVHSSSAIMNLSDAVVYAGIIQNTLSRRGFTRVDVRHNADVSCMWKSFWHFLLYLII